METVSTLRYGLSHLKFLLSREECRDILHCRVVLRAADFSGRVVFISDGDTISVMRDGRAEKVRLHGIDAPEKGQPFSNRAKRFVSDLVYTTWGWKHSSSRTAGALV